MKIYINKVLLFNKIIEALNKLDKNKKISELIDLVNNSLLPEK